MATGYPSDFHERMEIEYQKMDSALRTPEDNLALSGTTSNFGLQSIGVRLVSSLLEGAMFIISRGTNEIKNIPQRWHRPLDSVIRKFDGLSQLSRTDKEFFHALINAYGDLFDIRLHLIVYSDYKYIQIDETNFADPNEPPCPREDHAFIWCQCDTLICAPLYKTEPSGNTISVFKTGDPSILQDVQSFFDQLNQQFTFNQNPTGQPLEDLNNSSGNSTISDAPSMNLSIQGNELPPIIGTPQAVIGQMLQEISERTSHLGALLNEGCFSIMITPLHNQTTEPQPPETLAAQIQVRLSVISNMVTMTIPENGHAPIVVQNAADENGSLVPPGETTDVVPTDLNGGDARPVTLADVPDTAQVLPTPTSILFPYAPPNIVVGPKSEWDYRSMKDLSKNELPLLNGVGGQRAPIQVEVPSKGTEPMYLGVDNRTIGGGEHPSKIVVPKGIYVGATPITKDNDLSQLRFDEHPEGDRFDLTNRRVYLRISDDEHKAHKKDVLIRMFNLYQSGPITKQLISTEQLELCQLAFRLYVWKDEAFEPVSAASLSNTITEVKKHIH